MRKLVFTSLDYLSHHCLHMILFFKVDLCEYCLLHCLNVACCLISFSPAFINRPIIKHLDHHRWNAVQRWTPKTNPAVTMTVHLSLHLVFLLAGMEQQWRQQAKILRGGKGTDLEMMGRNGCMYLSEILSCSKNKLNVGCVWVCTRMGSMCWDQHLATESLMEQEHNISFVTYKKESLDWLLIFSKWMKINTFTLQFTFHHKMLCSCQFPVKYKQRLDW